MNSTCIVTGGAGFIGCALSHRLAGRFDRVIAVDNMHPAVHQSGRRPARLHPDVQLRQMDVRCRDSWDKLLEEVESGFTVIHLAAETGTGVSASQATRHADVNVCGLTCMLDAFVSSGKMPGLILLTSSRAVYGEGRWQRTDGEIFLPGQRSHEQLTRAQWDFPDAHALPQAARHTPVNPTSIYGATKLAQEHILSIWGASYAVPVRIARLQNVYGPGQSLTNSETGILQLFARQARDGKTLKIYEDGRIMRDFVYIDDVADALMRMLDVGLTAGQICDIGSGRETLLMQAAEWIAARYGAPQPEVCGLFREGDVRHSVCDPAPAKELLGFEARVSLEEGLEQFCRWADEMLDK